MNKLLIAADSVFGTINPPASVATNNPGLSLGNLLNVVFKMMIVIAGIYTLINLILAGYSFMSAGDDVKKVQGAWAMIWQSLLGLAVTAGAFVLAAIFGELIFHDPTFILKPTIPTL